MKPFIHLHNHTEYSTLDGLTRVTELVDAAVANKQPAIAITDHGMLSGAPEFYKEAKAKGIVPILGEEFYIVRDSSRDTTEKDTDSGNRHLLMLALNLKGWHLMVELTSLANTPENFYRRPRLDHNILRQYRKEFKNVAVTTTCLSSEIARALQNEGEEAADEFLEIYRNLFPNFYLEFQRHPVFKKYLKQDTYRATQEKEFDELQKRYEKYLRKRMTRWGIPPLITNDAHYPAKEDADIHDFMLAMQIGKDYRDKERWTFNGSGYWIKSTEQMHVLWGDSGIWKQSLRNQHDLVRLASGFHVPEFETSIWHIPSIPGQSKNPVSLLARECRRALKSRDLLARKYKRRLEHELKVIRQANFEQIFLIVADYVSWAKKQDIVVGAGRGSMVGSLVSYLLGITDVDPVKYRLLFERAINPARPSIPDFDIDFDRERVGEVIEYVRQKYGEDNVMIIGTDMTLQPRATVKGVLRTLKVPFDVANHITSTMPELVDIVNNKVDGDIEQILLQVDVPELREVLEREPIAARAIMRLNGMVKSHGRHAAGVIISDGSRNLVKEVPQMYISTSKTRVSQYDMNALKKMHLVKFDFLVISTLNAISLAKKYIGFDPFKDMTEFDDEDVFTMMREGNLVTIFQFQGGAARQCIMAMGIDKFEDLVAVNAIARPGSIKFLPTYVVGKQDPDKIKYPCPEVKPILSYTYGVIIYQEQVMEIVKELAGWDDLGADRIKEAIKSKAGKEFDEMHPEFIQGCIKKGISKKAANTIWKNIDDYRAYGFNRAHAVAYSSIGYQTAWFKCHYPKEWLTAYLNLPSAEKNYDEVMDEIRRHKIPLLLPDINRSGSGFSVEKKGIRFGLQQIQGVGVNSVREILEEREVGGRFTSIEDFVERAQKHKYKNRRVMESLKLSGTLSKLDGERPSQSDEKKYLKTWVTSYPLDKYRNNFDEILLGDINREHLEDPEDAEVFWGGIINRIKEIRTKTGKPMAFMDVSYYGEQRSITMFPEQWNVHRDKISREGIVLIKGRRQADRNTIVANRVRIF